MPQEKYEPVTLDYQAAIKEAMKREGFKEAMDALENQQDLANLRQLIEARVAEAKRGEVSAKSITEVAAEVVRSR